MPIHVKSLQQFEQIRSELVQKSGFSYRKKPFSSSSAWGIFNDGTIRRQDREFFSITGARGHSLKKFVPVMEQPLIYQPTNAINGFLLAGRGTGLDLLFQARVEPGNRGVVQLAPTVQSTVANYRQVHGGRPTSYIEKFLHCEPGDLLYRGLHSEEGSRYHGKYNHNLITRIDRLNVSDNPNFCIVSAETLKALICRDYIINTDARALLFFLDWDLLGDGGQAFGDGGSPIHRALGKSYTQAGADTCRHTLQTLRNLLQHRADIALHTEHVPLTQLSNWTLSDQCLTETTPQLGFSVSLYEVYAGNREVAGWDQPLISSDTEGRIILFCRVNQGVMEFLVSYDHEIGYLESTQLSASLAIAPGRRTDLLAEDELMLLAEADGAATCDILLECRQSEEGGRFDNDINHYQIILTDRDFSIIHPGNYTWLTLSQLKELSSLPTLVAIELRCILSLLIELT